MGDDWGRITFYSALGEPTGQGISGTSRITTLDKYGSQIVYAGDNKVGVFNLATMEVYQQCEPSIGNIVDVSQDYGATYIYAAIDNGEIIIYETKYSSINSAPLCKAVSRLLNNQKINKLAVIKNSLLASSEESLTSHNVSGIEHDIFYQPTPYKVNNIKGQIGVKSLRLPNSGNYLIMYGNSEILCFEVTLVGSAALPND